MSPVAEGTQYLLFRSGSHLGALALADVHEVMRPLPIEPVTGAPSFVLGIAIIRGLASPVIDAARLLNDAAVTEPARFISLRVASRSACLAVDSVLDVRTLPAEQLQAAPALLSDSRAAVLPLIGALDRELLLVFDSARLVPETVWNAIQTGARPS